MQEAKGEQASWRNATDQELNQNNEECKTILPPNFTSPSFPDTENMNNVLWLF